MALVEKLVLLILLLTKSVGELYLYDGMKKVLKAKKPAMPGEGFTKWDYVGIAQHFYIKYQFDSCKEQEQEFHNTIQRILAFVETEYQTGNLDKLGIWPWCTLPSGKQWTLHKWVTVNTVAPYKKASTLIKKFIKEL